MTFARCPWKEHADSVNSSDMDGFTFTASKSPVQCTAARQRGEVGAPCTCKLETNAHTSPGSLWSPSAVPACSYGWEHGIRPSRPPAPRSRVFWRKILPTRILPHPSSGTNGGPRGPRSYTTLVCSSQPIPPHGNPALSPGLPCLRHRTRVMRPQSTSFLRNSDNQGRDFFMKFLWSGR